MVFGSLALAGRQLIATGVNEPMRVFFEQLQPTTPMTSGAYFTALTDALRQLLQDIWPTLLVLLGFSMSVGLLLSALATGGITRAALKAQTDREPGQPTQALLNECRWSLKWYLTALLQNAIILLVAALPLALLTAALVWNDNDLLVSFGSLAAIALAVVVLMTQTVTALFFPLTITRPKSLWRIPVDAFKLCRGRWGLIAAFSFIMVLVQMLAMLVNFGGSDGVSILLNILISGLFTPIPAVAACLLFQQLDAAEAQQRTI